MARWEVLVERSLEQGKRQSEIHHQNKSQYYEIRNIFFACQRISTAAFNEHGKGNDS